MSAMQLLTRLSLVVALALPFWAEAKELTLVFTGDNGGEVAPCG